MDLSMAPAVYNRPNNETIKKLNVLETHLSKQDVLHFNLSTFFSEMNDLYKNRKLTDQELSDNLTKAISDIKNHIQHEKRILNMLSEMTRQIKNSSKIH